MADMQHLEGQIKALADRRDAGEAPGTQSDWQPDYDAETGSYELVP